jgi:hypothetical protein
MNNPEPIDSEEIRCKWCNKEVYLSRANDDTWTHIGGFIGCLTPELHFAEPINSVSPENTKEEKIPCYEVYADGKDHDFIVFAHSRMDDLQTHIWLLLDSLEAGESIRIEFQPYT